MNKEETLRQCFEDVIWMAIRYAHGRHTYAPHEVRSAIKKFKEIYPDFKLRPDRTIKPPDSEEIGGFSFREDFLDDLFKGIEGRAI